MVNETNMVCGPDRDNSPSCIGDGTSDPDFEITKTHYIAKLYASAIAENLVAVIWYDLTGTWRNSGLLFLNHDYKDPFWAYKTARDSLRDATWTRDLSEYVSYNVIGYEFDRTDRNIWVLWSKDGSNHPITLPGIPLSAWDVLNNEVIVSSTSLTVGLEPIYLEWSK